MRGISCDLCRTKQEGTYFAVLSSGNGRLSASGVFGAGVRYKRDKRFNCVRAPRKVDTPLSKAML
jgi:hypothetical protein